MQGEVTAKYPVDTGGGDRLEGVLQQCAVTQFAWVVAGGEPGKHDARVFRHFGTLVTVEKDLFEAIAWGAGVFFQVVLVILH